MKLVKTLIAIAALLMAGCETAKVGRVDLDNPKITSRVTAEEAAAKKRDTISLHLVALGPIERLILSDDGAKPPQQKYYERMNLKAGWEENFSIRGPFRCYASALENIRYIVNDGQELMPEKSGPGHFITERGITDSNNSASVKKITLRLATYGPIERLILSDDGAKPQKIYYERSSIKAGWEESFSINGSFRCYASSLENIRFIINDGQEFVPKKSGPGSFIWPPEVE